MSYYAVFNTATKEIVRSGSCPAAMIPLQLGQLDPAVHKAVQTSAPVDDVEDTIENGKHKKRPMAERLQRKKALADSMKPPAGFKSREDKLISMLRHLKASGVDLGPDSDLLDT